MAKLSDLPKAAALVAAHRKAFGEESGTLLWVKEGDAVLVPKAAHERLNVFDIEPGVGPRHSVQVRFPVQIKKKK